MFRQSPFAYLVSIALASSCGFDPAVGVDSMGLSAESLGLLQEQGAPPEVEVQLRGVLNQQFGSILAPRFPGEFAAGGSVAGSELEAAARLYRGQCMHCHGVEGGGDGRSAYFLTPPPTDFRPGTFKWTALERSHPPRLEDIEQALRRGVPFTSMPSFSRLGDRQLTGLAQVVRWLAVRGQVERWLVAEWVQGDGSELSQSEVESAVVAVAEGWNESDQHLVLPAQEPSPGEMGPERIARGRSLYFGDLARCSACHGQDLEGDGPAVFQTITDSDGVSSEERVPDEWGFPSRPRDLRQAGFRGGSSPLDLYRRIRVGISGSIMPGASESLDDDAVWDLVYFVLSEAGLHPPGEDR
jgi:mono/diheme cytochrome c family protein